MFTDEQLDVIIEHVINYLFGDVETFELKMNNVNTLSVGIKDGVDVFGHLAVEHMKDVKNLINKIILINVFCFIFTLFGLIYFICRRKNIDNVLVRYSFIFYTAIAFFILLFCVWTSLTSSGNFAWTAWENLHYLFFPFQKDKFIGSIFNDALTNLLSIELFLTAIYIVLTVLVVAIIAWFVFVFKICKISRVRRLE